MLQVQFAPVMRFCELVQVMRRKRSVLVQSFKQYIVAFLQHQIGVFWRAFKTKSTAAYICSHTADVPHCPDAVTVRYIPLWMPKKRFVPECAGALFYNQPTI